MYEVKKIAFKGDLLVVDFEKGSKPPMRIQAPEELGGTWWVVFEPCMRNQSFWRKERVEYFKQGTVPNVGKKSEKRSKRAKSA